MNPLNHVAIIMDGNGRWGLKYKGSRNEGHKAGLNTVEKIIKEKKDLEWTDSDKEKQHLKRGRYVEFNLVYDRGTKFGLETGGNTDAILMSLPPKAKW